MKIFCNKRDIDAAFKRVKLHPDMCVIVCTEFAENLLGIDDDEEATVIFLYLTLSFGWRASPSYFSQVGEGITVAHSEYAYSDRNRDGADPSSSKLFVDDAIFIEPDLGCREELVISCWEYVCRSLLGKTAINDGKLDLEGTWKEEHIILGFEVNVDKLTIKHPTAKRIDAWHFFDDHMLNPGNRIIAVRKIQEMRGLINHWSCACRFWHYIVSPVNALLSFAEQTGTWIRCGNDQVWLAFWNLVEHVRKMGEGDHDWESIFHGTLEQITPVPKRAGRPKSQGKTIWATGDAVLERIGAINWESMEYILEENGAVVMIL